VRTARLGIGQRVFRHRAGRRIELANMAFGDRCTRCCRSCRNRPCGPDSGVFSVYSHGSVLGSSRPRTLARAVTKWTVAAASGSRGDRARARPIPVETVASGNQHCGWWATGKLSADNPPARPARGTATIELNTCSIPPACAPELVIKLSPWHQCTWPGPFPCRSPQAIGSVHLAGLEAGRKGPSRGKLPRRRRVIPFA
jgi:hypothetical protein